MAMNMRKTVLEMLEFTAPNITVGSPDIRDEFLNTFVDMVEKLQNVASKYETTLEVTAKEQRDTLVPMIVADENSMLWAEISDIAVEARDKSSRIAKFHLEQDESDVFYAEFDIEDFKIAV